MFLFSNKNTKNSSQFNSDHNIWVTRLSSDTEIEILFEKDLYCLFDDLFANLEHFDKEKNIRLLEAHRLSKTNFLANLKQLEKPKHQANYSGLYSLFTNEDKKITDFIIHLIASTPRAIGDETLILLNALGDLSLTKEQKKQILEKWHLLIGQDQKFKNYSSANTCVKAWINLLEVIPADKINHQLLSSLISHHETKPPYSIKTYSYLLEPFKKVGIKTIIIEELLLSTCYEDIFKAFRAEAKAHDPFYENNDEILEEGIQRALLNAQSKSLQDEFLSDDFFSNKAKAELDKIFNKKLDDAKFINVITKRQSVIKSISQKLKSLENKYQGLITPYLFEEETPSQESIKVFSNMVMLNLEFFDEKTQQSLINKHQKTFVHSANITMDSFLFWLDETLSTINENQESIARINITLEQELRKIEIDKALQTSSEVEFAKKLESLGIEEKAAVMNQGKYHTYILMDSCIYKNRSNLSKSYKKLAAKTTKDLWQKNTLTTKDIFNRITFFDKDEFLWVFNDKKPFNFSKIIKTSTELKELLTLMERHQKNIEALELSESASQNITFVINSISAEKLASFLIEDIQDLKMRTKVFSMLTLENALACNEALKPQFLQKSVNSVLTSTLNNTTFQSAMVMLSTTLGLVSQSNLSFFQSVSSGLITGCAFSTIKRQFFTSCDKPQQGSNRTTVLRSTH